MTQDVLSANAPVGIFDSGIGGVSVALAIRQQLPQESLIYVADTAFAPYGAKQDDAIYRRMQTITTHLLKCGVKAVVVACNTATTAGISRLRSEFNVPIIGVEPGLKPAVLASRSGIVGVLATARTLLNPAFSALQQRFTSHATVLLQPCPELVPLIEAMALQSPEMHDALTRYITPLIEQGADTLVLGCTHYNFVAALISEIAGPNVTIIRTENAVAIELQRRLMHSHLLAKANNSTIDTFYTSGAVELFSRQLQQLWPAAQPVLSL
ncbi:glutamate racemase [Alishewanella tabrizica]|uniref:Glutamate racemase n=1 Tax=Alishewanella tabrizica TaxID=671278 RepID=A0ABQ2WJI7_9ALTE|nr:glutamate racemase [Alishewanella tabrizica]GGW59758.1 glutamate racemase [Alishewanella tabrizica]